MTITKERRSHQRFVTPDNVLALSTWSYGQVVNISMSGMRIKYLLHRQDRFQDSFEVGLLNDSGDHYLAKLPCRVVSCLDTTPSSMPANLFIREAGVMFDSLSPSQARQLADFVMKNTLINT